MGEVSWLNDAKEGMSCDHEDQKVFSGWYKAMWPVRWIWICRKCGDRGYSKMNEVPNPDRNEYAALVEKFHGGDELRRMWGDVVFAEFERRQQTKEP